MNPTSHSRHVRLRPTLLALALALALPAAAVRAQGTGGAHDVTTPVTFAIPAKPLSQALADWTAQSRIPLNVAPDLVAGKTAPAVSGSLPPMAALQRLLGGADLEAQSDGSGVVVRRTVSGATLPQVRVRAAAAATPLGYLAKKSTTGALGDKAVLDTPFSITVVDSKQIVERGATSIGQIFFNDASVYTPTSAGTTDWWGTQIRGLGVRNMYIDDVPMALYWGGDFAPEVVESVTALKGLTGFMYGFGEPGGALSYKLKRPGKVTETTVTAGFRNSSLFGAHVDTTQVFGDDLALRANLATVKGTAYNAAKVDRVVASLALDKEFGASVKWFSTFVYEDNKLKGEPLQFYIDGYDTVTSGGRLPAVSYDYGRMNVDEAYYNSKTLLVSTGVDWRIDDRWTLKSQIGASRRDHESYKSFANLENIAGDYSASLYSFANRQDTTFAQTVLTGTVSVAGMKHDLVAGVGLQRATDRSSPYDFAPAYDGNLYGPQTYVPTTIADFEMGPVSWDVRQRAVFASDTVHLTDRLQALVGLRYTHYDSRDLDGDATVESGYRIGKVSPTLALIYKPDLNTSIYGSYVEALEPGSRVGATYLNAGEILGATVSKQGEVGVKHQSETYEYTAALFQIQRVAQIDNGVIPNRTLTQDGLTVYRGVELSAAHQATRNLNVGAGLVFLEGEIDKVSPSNAALQGNTPGNVGRWQAVVHTEYKVPVLPGLKLHGAVRYFGATVVSDDNLLTVPARTIVNAGFSHAFDVQGRNWTLIGNLNNVFNQKYWASGGWGSGALGEARNGSLALQTKF